MCKLLHWILPKKRLHIRKNVPWPHDDIHRVVDRCLTPFEWPAIEKHGIVITMSSKPLGHRDVGGATDGWVIALDSHTALFPLSKTALAHELEHVRMVMLGDKMWATHSLVFLERVAENNRVLKQIGL
jgi:hypothetical protein